MWTVRVSIVPTWHALILFSMPQWEHVSLLQTVHIYRRSPHSLSGLPLLGSFDVGLKPLSTAVVYFNITLGVDPLWELWSPNKRTRLFLSIHCKTQLYEFKLIPLFQIIWTPLGSSPRGFWPEAIIYEFPRSLPIWCPIWTWNTVGCLEQTLF